MENVYDIRLKENLLYILSQKQKIQDISMDILKQTVIVVNLYYLDMVEYYMEYLNGVPEEIDIYVISSNSLIWEQVRKYKGRPMNFLEKNNRGRDISALLVVFREIAIQYEYICFLHDKKPNHERLKQDVELWTRNLWENSIASEEYIYNVLSEFQNNPQMGLFVPPEPLGEYFAGWYGNTWWINYNNVIQLAKELQLNCNIDKEKNPITVGTVFWGRVNALRKLFDKQWQYEDFPQEPMPLDGTISHAIERIFAYVVQDAGYKTATIMTAEYAQWKLLFTQECMREMHRELKVQNMHQLHMLKEQEQHIRSFCKKNEKIYLYGTGVFGVGLLELMQCWNIYPTGFVVSNGRRKQMEVNGFPVIELRELQKDDKSGIIIAVNYINQKELVRELERVEFTNYIFGYI